MKILYAASEAVPFIKSGGLADVAGSLTMAVRNRQNACRVVLPLYEDIACEYREKMSFVTSFNVPLGWRNQYCGVFELTLSGLKFYFIDNEYYFKRTGLYGFFDDGERFAFFSKAILEMLVYIDFEPEIIHCNDWQTALVPMYLNVYYRHLEKFRDIKTVFTIHNIQYQGTYDLEIATDVLGLPSWEAHRVEFAKDANFMKGAIVECDEVTTVSPTYAAEILDPWFAHGLDGLLREHRYKLRGILNGIDVAIYNPETDKRIFADFSAADPSGKAENKRQLQLALNLNTDENVLLLAMVTRLVDHKGLDLVQQAFGEIMQHNVQLVLLGTGDWQYEKFFREMEAYYPNRISVTLSYDEPLSHRIYAGADALLMPSKSEPCGLSQLIALRYGTIPIVRSTGGLRDTVRDFGGENGNGYDFQTYNAFDMLDALRRCLGDFADRDVWNMHVKSAMKCDFSWGQSAASYIALYKSLLDS